MVEKGEPGSQASIITKKGKEASEMKQWQPLKTLITDWHKNLFTAELFMVFLLRV